MKSIHIGKIISYEGHEWVVTSVGKHTVRLERGFGPSLSVIIVPYSGLFN